jgi:hypothetical protein
MLVFVFAAAAAAAAKPGMCVRVRRAAPGSCLLKYVASSVGSISTIVLLPQVTTTRTCAHRSDAMHRIPRGTVRRTARVHGTYSPCDEKRA